jgi:putative transposase
MTHDNIVPENGLFDFEAFRKEAAKRMKAGQPLTGELGILTSLIKSIVEASLDAEIEQHMEDCDEAGVTNRRNGKLSKTVQTGSGPIEIETPRDRAGTFEPEIVKKRQTILNLYSPRLAAVPCRESLKTVGFQV